MKERGINNIYYGSPIMVLNHRKERPLGQSTAHPFIHLFAIV
jgi:hypothetical protein